MHRMLLAQRPILLILNEYFSKCVHIIKNNTRATHYSSERIIDALHRHPGLGSEKPIQSADKTAAARNADPALHNIRNKFGRSFLD